MIGATGMLVGTLALAGCSGQAQAATQTPAAVVTHNLDLDALAKSLAKDVQALERKSIAEYRASRGFPTGERGGVQPVDVALAVTPLTVDNPHLLKQLETTAKALIPDKKDPGELLNSTVTVKSVKQVSVDARHVIADVELEYHHPRFNQQVIDSRQVIAHRITISQKTGDIVADEIRDEAQQGAQASKPAASGSSSDATPSSKPK